MYFISHLLGGLLLALKRAQILRCLRGLARCGEDRPLVVGEQPEPRFDVRRVPELPLDIEMSTQEGGRELCYELLGDVTLLPRTDWHVAQYMIRDVIPRKRWKLRVFEMSFSKHFVMRLFEKIR